MKKSPYLNKYDFIDYYTKQPSFWFFSNDEINEAIKKVKILKQKLSDEDEEEIIEDEEEFDSYEYLKMKQFYDEKIDNDDPRIIEGNIIDELSKSFVIQSYKEIKLSTDFSSKEYNGKKLEELAILTKEAITKNKNIILFQPVFIYNDLITKPDAIIKNENEIILVETKSTTAAKRHHLLDVFFQYKILCQIDYLEDYYFDLNLCLVKYCRANKYEVPLIITNSFLINSSIGSGIPNEHIKSNLKLGLGIYSKTDGYIESPITLNNVCELNEIDFEKRFEIASPSSREPILKNKYRIFTDLQDYEKVLNKLREHKIKLSKTNGEININSIAPNYREKSYWKKSDLFKELRDYYAQIGYEAFNYSGNITSQDELNIKTMKKNENVDKYFKKELYRDIFLGKKDVYINNVRLDEMLKKIKDKKVYFDFETINSPIRPIDNCFPFTQILTQCSVIIDDGTKSVDKLECNNIVLDPTNITINHFKEIVDAIYCSNDYSYIVFNKNFEKARLNEMKEFIDEEEYDEKINTIINNIHDLADYFKVSDKCPVIIKELGGFYSIKKVLPYIEKHYSDIYKKSGCINYHDLEVIQNGKVCQLETTKRFHNLINENEWNKLVFNLKKYCENDVRAMIAVEYYLRSLL